MLIFRCYNFCKHGNRNARAVSAYLDDGYNGSRTLETRGDVFTSEHKLSHRSNEFSMIDVDCVLEFFCIKML